MESDEGIFGRWIRHVFDHPVTKPEWYWGLNAEEWEIPAAETVACIARTFEEAGSILRPFSDAQVAQGLNYFFSPACSDLSFALLDHAVPWEERRRAMASIYSLFEQCLAPRCASELSAGWTRVANPLNGICYMWWDVFPAHGVTSHSPQHPDGSAIDQVVLDVLQRTLELESDPCRESALHGLNHLAHSYAKQVEAIIDRFLRDHPYLRPALREYARDARRGRLL